MAKAGLQFSKKDEWYTPKEIVDKFGQFDYDPATTEERAKYLEIPNFDTIETDGLSSDWSNYRYIWINPPFSRKFDFLKKLMATLQNPNRIETVCVLLPIETLTTRNFHEIVTETFDVIIPNGRIKFDDGMGGGTSPAFGSVVLVFGKGCQGKMMRCKL